MYTQTNGYIVLQTMINGQTQPVFRGDDNALCFYVDHASAQADIDDHIEMSNDAAREGFIDDPDVTDDYQIAPATIINPWLEPNEQTIVCYMDGIRHMMIRSDDDWRISEEDVNAVTFAKWIAVNEWSYYEYADSFTKIVEYKKRPDKNVLTQLSGTQLYNQFKSQLK